MNSCAKWVAVAVDSLVAASLEVSAKMSEMISFDPALLKK